MDEQAKMHCCQSRTGAVGLKTWSWSLRHLIIAVCLLSQVRSSSQGQQPHSSNHTITK